MLDTEERITLTGCAETELGRMIGTLLRHHLGTFTQPQHVSPVVGIDRGSQPEQSIAGLAAIRGTAVVELVLTLRQVAGKIVVLILPVVAVGAVANGRDQSDGIGSEQRPPLSLFPNLHLIHARNQCDAAGCTATARLEACT